MIHKNNMLSKLQNTTTKKDPLPAKSSLPVQNPKTPFSPISSGISKRPPSPNIVSPWPSQNQKPLITTPLARNNSGTAPLNKGSLKALTAGTMEAAGTQGKSLPKNPLGNTLQKSPQFEAASSTVAKGSPNPGEAVKKKHTGIFGKLLEKGSDGVKSLIGKGVQTAKKAKGALGSLLETGKEGVQDLLSKGSQVAKGAKELFTNALETGKDGVKSLLKIGGRAVEGLKELAGNVLKSDEVKSLLEKGGKIAEGAKELFSGLLEKGKEKALEFADGAKNVFWNTVAGVVEFGAEKVHSFQENFNAFKEKLPVQMQEAINNGMETLKETGGTVLDGLRSVINPGLHKIVEIANSAGIDTAEIGAYLLDMDEDLETKGVYHARTDARQSKVGYNVLYDLGFGVGTDIEHPERLEFTVGEQDYVFWGWKADYLNMGPGAELGIYKRMGDTDHWLADPDDPNDPYDSSLVFPMSMEMTDKKGNELTSYHPQEDQWWITTFDSRNLGMHPDDFNAEFTVDLSGDEEMRKAIVQAVEKKTKECEADGTTSKWSISEDKDGNPVLKLNM